MVYEMTPEEIAKVAYWKKVEDKARAEKEEDRRKRDLTRGLAGERPKPPHPILSSTTVLFTPQMGKRMLHARHLLHLTQEQLATRIGISRQTISNIENGRRKRMPSVNTRQIWEAFGKYADYVVLGNRVTAIEGNLPAKSPWRSR